MDASSTTNQWRSSIHVGLLQGVTHHPYLLRTCLGLFLSFSSHPSSTCPTCSGCALSVVLPSLCPSRLSAPLAGQGEAVHGIVGTLARLLRAMAGALGQEFFHEKEYSGGPNTF